MPRNGSGTYAPPAGQPVVSGTTVSSAVFNALVADLGTEFTRSVSTDGQTPMAAALPMGANKITGLAPGTLPSDAVRLDQSTAPAALAAPTGSALIGGTWYGGVVAALSSFGTTVGSSLMGFIAAGGGAVGRSLQAKVRELAVSVIDQGGVADGATSNATAVANTEAASSAVITVPDGVYALPDSTVFLKEYVGPGIWSFGGVQIPQARKARVQEIVQGSSVVLGDLAQFYAAIAANSCTVVACGDSITEGVSQTTYEDSWFSQFSEDLRRRCLGVTFSIQNLSLAGMDIGAAQSAAFVGGASDDFATIFNRPKGTASTYPSSNANMNVITGNADLWPSGSTNGKAWRDHLKDATPDLLIIAHGQNISSSNSAGWASSLKSLITYAKTWAKIPSIVIVTACPATRKQAAWRTNGPYIQAAAEAARGVALETGSTLVDANRQYLMLRDGTDMVNMARQPVPISGYPTNWSGMSPMPVLASSTLTWAAIGTIYNTSANHQARDLHYTAQFTPAVNGQALGLIYRSPGASGYEAQVSGAFIRLYWGVTVLAATAITQLVGGTTHQLDVICVGARHQVYLDGVKLIDVYDYNSLISGGVGVEMNGAGTVAYLSLLQGIPRVIGPAILTEDELLGVSSTEYSANIATKGGDGIHHPSFMIGHYSIYYAASLGLVDAAARAANRPTTFKSITPNAGNNAIGSVSPNVPTSYLSADGFVQLSGSLTPNGATTIAAGATAATLNIAHVPNREVDGMVYIAGALAYCRVLANGNIIFGTNVTAGQLANMDGFRFKQTN